MKILLFGSEGQLGKSIKEKFQNSFNLIIPSRLDYDFLKPNSLIKCLDKIKPELIINAAAYTNVDKAEKKAENKNVYLINSNALKVISQNAKKNSSMLIHFSSDYIFDGIKISKYKENDVANPLNIYGKSKLQGEMFIKQYMSNFLIIRTSWVFSKSQNNFINKILKLCSEKESFNVIDDQVGTPTSTDYIAETIKKLIECYLNDKEKFKFGIYNVSGDEETSWFHFAQFIIDQAISLKLILNPKFKNIDTILSKDFKQLAARPKYSSLDAMHLYETFGIDSCNWKNEVIKILKASKNGY